MTSFTERLNDIALEAAQAADSSGNLEQHKSALRRTAHDVASLAIELEGIERLMPPANGFPNARQSLTLGRFLNQAMRDDQFERHPERAWATVSRSNNGVGGVGGDYLGVRFADHYEGGIDRDGRLST